MGKNIGELFIERVEEEVIANQDIVTSGGVKDFADYRYRVGKIDGLQSALIEFEELLKKLGD